MLDNIRNVSDNKRANEIFFDFRKAFNTVDRDILCNNLLGGMSMKVSNVIDKLISSC